MKIPLTDQTVLDLLRRESSLSVSDLVDRLGVTTTAVRQRVNRLMAAELITRVEERSGKGRPSHQYRITEKGQKTAGNNLNDLAIVLWKEILQIEDNEIKQALINRVIQQLTEKYEQSVGGETFEERLSAIAVLLGERKIPLSVETLGDSQILKMHGCPYPELVDENREICEVEKQLFSSLLKTDLSLDQCQCSDAGHCCTFKPLDNK